VLRAVCTCKGVARRSLADTLLAFLIFRMIARRNVQATSRKSPERSRIARRRCIVRNRVSEVCVVVDEAATLRERSTPLTTRLPAIEALLGV
jgi:hypothetical protein